MTLRIGDTAPDFTIDTTEGPIKFHDWAKGSWVFFFSHPADYTPVCTTEMGRTSQLAPEFEKRNVKPLGLSTDSVDAHKGWITILTKLRIPFWSFQLLPTKSWKWHKNTT